jgi:hypothetical protein
LLFYIRVSDLLTVHTTSVNIFIRQGILLTVMKGIRDCTAL